MAAKPVLLAVDDEEGVLRAVERDLRRAYAREYRVMRASSGRAALDALRQLKLRADPVALLLVDQRMPRMSGVELLAEARELYPTAKRVLLTAYADTDAAIGAINTADVDHYLLKPWDPPEERLYPTVGELLEDWQRDYHPPYQGIRLVGTRWSPESYEAREFLERNLVDYRWVDAESADGQAALEYAQADPAALPLVLLPDAPPLVAPSRRELAERAGLRTTVERDVYDLLIVGAGPAGLAAAVYGASEGLRTVLVEEHGLGGQAGTSAAIENYLGFPDGLTGRQLTDAARRQVDKFGAQVLSAQVTGLQADGDYRLLTLDDGTQLVGHTVLLTVGLEWRHLDAPGIEQLVGAGVYYGASAVQAADAEGRHVYLVGGGNSAGQAALAFVRAGARVDLLVRGDSLQRGMSRYLVDRIERTESITVRTCSEVVGAHGDGHLEALEVTDARAGRTVREEADGLYLFIGAAPHTGWLHGTVRTDERGFVLTGPDLVSDGRPPAAWRPDRDPALLETSMPGVFAAGDVRRGSVKRVGSGVGEGAMAVQFVHRYLDDRVVA